MKKKLIIDGKEVNFIDAGMRGNYSYLSGLLAFSFPGTPVCFGDDKAYEDFLIRAGIPKSQVLSMDDLKAKGWDQKTEKNLFVHGSYVKHIDNCKTTNFISLKEGSKNFALPELKSDLKIQELDEEGNWKDIYFLKALPDFEGKILVGTRATHSDSLIKNEDVLKDRGHIHKKEGQFVKNTDLEFSPLDEGLAREEMAYVDNFTHDGLLYSTFKVGNKIYRVDNNKSGEILFYIADAVKEGRLVVQTIAGVLAYFNKLKKLSVSSKAIDYTRRRGLVIGGDDDVVESTFFDPTKTENLEHFGVMLSYLEDSSIPKTKRELELFSLCSRMGCSVGRLPEEFRKDFEALNYDVQEFSLGKIHELCVQGLQAS